MVFLPKGNVPSVHPLATSNARHAPWPPKRTSCDTPVESMPTLCRDTLLPKSTTHARHRERSQRNRRTPGLSPHTHNRCSAARKPSPTWGSAHSFAQDVNYIMCRHQTSAVACRSGCGHTLPSRAVSALQHVACNNCGASGLPCHVWCLIHLPSDDTLTNNRDWGTTCRTLHRGIHLLRTPSF